ncbi:helix-turn-helix transcriptional regulator [Antrihabitans spumae]|uniref:Helix-turn-helix transcriptional regulator n=1 Tax=Antrihabitans spumae TaxID=3373370 RepID=A0ABW7KA93_9NOCA
MSTTVSANNPSEADGPHPYSKPTLSDREIEVLLAWFSCDTKANVGKGLYISLGTVNTHLARVRQKYECVGRAAPTKAALVARALQDGLIDVKDL